MVVLWAAGVVLAGIAVMAASYWRRLRLEVTETTLRLAKLPSSFSGLRIALISDIHLGYFYSLRDMERLVRVVNARKPDLICLTGDLVDSRRSLRLLGPAAVLLEKLEAPLGRFAVLGNHDCYAGPKQVVKALERSGFEVLVNRTACIRRGRDSLYIAGLDDVMWGKPNLDRVEAEVPQDAFAILLVHEPDPAPGSRDHEFALQLSGHSHGGQVCVPGWGPLLTTKLGKTYLAGLYARDSGRARYTSRGVGTTFLPFRWFCRAELAMLTLFPADRDDTAN